MPRFVITTKNRLNNNGVRLEPGMSIKVVTQSMSNPVLINDGQSVIYAFIPIYGIDIKKANALNMAYLDVKQYQ